MGPSVPRKLKQPRPPSSLAVVDLKGNTLQKQAEQRAPLKVEVITMFSKWKTTERAPGNTTIQQMALSRPLWAVSRLASHEPRAGCGLFPGKGELF